MWIPHCSTCKSTMEWQRQAIATADGITVISNCFACPKCKDMWQAVPDHYEGMATGKQAYTGGLWSEDGRKLLRRAIQEK